MWYFMTLSLSIKVFEYLRYTFAYLYFSTTYHRNVPKRCLDMKGKLHGRHYYLFCNQSSFALMMRNQQTRVSIFIVKKGHQRVNSIKIGLP